MRDDGFERRHVGRKLARSRHLQLRRELAHLREAHDFENANVGPAEIEFVPPR